MSDIQKIQKVPASIYKASYPCYFFNRNNIINKMGEKGFSIIREWPDKITFPFRVNGKNWNWATLVFRKYTSSMETTFNLADKKTENA